MNAQDAVADENVAGNLPTVADVGRQVKRLRTAEVLADVEQFPHITVDTVGERAVGIVSLSNQVIANVNNPGAALNVNMIVHAIAQACQPNGPIANTIRHALVTAEERNLARSVNSLIVRGDEDIVGLPNFDGQVPPNFPDTPDLFFAMSAAETDALITFYNVPNVEGNFEKRKKALARFTGVNYNNMERVS